MDTASASDTIFLYLPEVFDSELVSDEGRTWPDALLNNQSPRYSKQRDLGLILGAKKLRAGKVIERFGVPLAYGRMRARALQAEFAPEQILAWGYDWRRTPSEIVSDLLALPDPPGEGQIAILGHGYGGLVAKALMQAKPAWRDRVKAILYLGTPHHGCDIERLAPIICPFGWLSPTALRYLSDPRCPTPLQSLAVMARPWRYDVPKHCDGVREIDVFARCFATPLFWPHKDELAFLHGDGLHLAWCASTEENERMETDRFHADIPSCPKLWWYLAREVLGRRLKLLEAPWTSAAIHVQRSWIESYSYLAGLRFRGEANVALWIEAQEMKYQRGRFEPSDTYVRGPDLLTINEAMSPTNRVGNYLFLDLMGLEKFVRLTLWAASNWDNQAGAPSLLDERLVYVEPRDLEGDFKQLHQAFLGSAGAWLGQRPIASRGRAAKIPRPG